MKLTHYFPTFIFLLFGGLRVPAQQQTSFTDVHDFVFRINGGFPLSSLATYDNALYGTTTAGGTNGSGTVFSVNTDGSSFTVLHAFGSRADGDGASPFGGMVISGNTLFGTTDSGGTNGNGTVFSINTDGTGFTDLYSFSALTANSNIDGADPYAGLTLCSNTLYGTTQGGGTNGNGTVFAINTNGTGFTVLHFFSTATSGNFANADGANPKGGLILSGNTLYGTTSFGGTNGLGTVFAVNTDGTGFAVLHNFSTDDGIDPECGLALSGNTLYGTAPSGGTNGNGTLFAVGTNGVGFAVLHTFSAVGNSTNSDGSSPQAGLVSSGNTLFGTVTAGGANGHGAVFAVNTDGTQFSVLHSFSGGDGGMAVANLMFSANTLYGTTEVGGVSNNGTVFSLSNLPSIPQLNIAAAGNQTVIFYPLTGTNYTLQMTTNLASGTWVNVSNGVPLIAVGITNCAPAAFFRLH